VVASWLLLWSLAWRDRSWVWNLTSLWIMRFLFGAGEQLLSQPDAHAPTWLPVGERVRRKRVCGPSAAGRGAGAAGGVRRHPSFRFGAWVWLWRCWVGWVAAFLPGSKFPPA